MTTTRDLMLTKDEHLEDCIPYAAANGRLAFTVLNGAVESLQLDGAELPATPQNLKLAAQLANPDYDLYSGWGDTHILLEGDLTELPCRSCPWFDVCSLMDKELPFGHKLKAVRKAAGFTQASLAAAAGCTQKDISRWEAGIHEPSIQTLRRLATALGCLIDDIV